MYEIARRTTVPSDNVSHKVSVALVDFEPVFEYESVPKKAPHVFLKARVKNTSPYALLAGPTNIYLDNSYIAKVGPLCSLYLTNPNKSLLFYYKQLFF